MGFNIPNYATAVAAGVGDQAEPDSVDFQILGNPANGLVYDATSFSNNGVVAPEGTISNNVTVAPYKVFINGSYVVKNSSTTLSLGEGSASPRFDLVVIKAASPSAPDYIAGTPDGANPTFPAIAAGDIVLAAVYRAGSGTTGYVSQAKIIDKRLFVNSNQVWYKDSSPLVNTADAAHAKIGDLWMDTSASGAGQSMLWVKQGSSSWKNLAEYTAPSSSNTANTLVLRNASGNFSAGTVTASTFSGPLLGNVTGDVTGNVTGNLSGNAATATSSTYLQGFAPSTVGTIVGDTSIAQRSASGQLKSSWFEANVDSAHFYSTTSYTNFGQYCFRVLNSSTVYSQAISSGRAVLVNSNGTLGTSVSTVRVKENIKPLSADIDKILKIEPVTFFYKKNALEPDAARTLQVGVIAEQVSELGFEELLYRDPQGNVDGFAYEKLAVYLLKVVKSQKEQIDDLSARLTVLEGK